MKQEVTTRNNKGQFVKGVSGNPNGRPLGVKNRIVRQKLELEAAVREHVSPKQIRQLIQVMMAEALEGNTAAGKYILDKFISNASVEDEKDAAENGIQVVVKNATFKMVGEAEEPKPIEGEIVNDSQE